MTANPKSTLGRGKSHKCFKISDEYCSVSGEELSAHSFLVQRLAIEPTSISDSSHK